MSELVEFVNRLKGRFILPLPDEPETLVELLARVDADGKAAELKQSAYFEIGEREKEQVCVQLPLHFFTLSPDCRTVRLFWLGIEEDHGRAFGCRLDEDEIAEFADVFRVEKLLRLQKKPVTVQGFGPFRLCDFLPGESLFDQHGELLRVCKRQRIEGRVEVWTNPDSIRAAKEALDPLTRAFATDAEQEERIARRVQDRAKRKQRKRA